MTTMAYIIAGVCIALTIAGMVWYGILVRGGSDGGTDDKKAEEKGQEEKENLGRQGEA